MYFSLKRFAVQMCRLRLGRLVAALSQLVRAEMIPFRDCSYQAGRSAYGLIVDMTRSA